MEAPQRTPVRGPTFIRLIARLTDTDVPQPSTPLSDRLSQWIDWTRAVALSRALDAEPAPAEAETPDAGDALPAEVGAARRALQADIVGDPMLAATGQPATAATRCVPDAGTDPDAPPDFASFRQRYVALQRSMQATTGRLRGLLRDRIGSASADMARLAEVDAVMELVLSPREQTLLTVVPGLLGEHYDRLRRTASQAGDDNPPAERALAPTAWLDVFRKDMQNVLLAELDVRFQPLEGLLAAARSH